MIKNIKHRRGLLSLSATFFLATVNLSSPGFSVPTVDELEASIGYRFKKPGLVEAVFKHPSAHPENSKTFNCLEHLGDDRLRHAVTRILDYTYPDEDAGKRTEKRSHLVSNEKNSEVIDALGILKYIEYRGNGNLDKIKADTCEALLEAICEDSGNSDRMEAFVLRHWFPGSNIERESLDLPIGNPRHVLHQLKGPIAYTVLSDEAPYKVQISVNKMRIPAVFQGDTLKGAKDAAAMGALTHLGITEYVGATPPKQRNAPKQSKKITSVRVRCRDVSNTFAASTKVEGRKLGAVYVYHELTGQRVSPDEAHKELNAYRQKHKNTPKPVYTFY